MSIPLKVAVCEDQATDTCLLMGCIEQSGIDAQCDAFSSGEEFLESFAAGRYDIIFMDIYMNGIHGVQVVERIRKIDSNVVIAFVTTSAEHALEGYRLGVLKYLEKPVCAEGVEDAMRLAMMNRAAKETISLLVGGKHVDIPLDDILYFENQNHVVLVHTTSATLKTSQTVRLDHIAEKLLAHPFIRSHKSYLVNLRHVSKIDQTFGDFVMQNGDRACIRTRDRKKIQDAYEEYLFAAARKSQR